MSNIQSNTLRENPDMVHGKEAKRCYAEAGPVHSKCVCWTPFLGQMDLSWSMYHRHASTFLHCSSISFGKAERSSLDQVGCKRRLQEEAAVQSDQELKARGLVDRVGKSIGQGFAGGVDAPISEVGIEIGVGLAGIIRNSQALGKVIVVLAFPEYTRFETNNTVQC